MKRILIAIMLMATTAFAQTAQIRVKVVYTNDAGGEVAKDVTLEGWEATFNGSNWIAQVQKEEVGTNGVVTAGRIECNEADIEAADPYRGLILTAPNATKFIVSVATNGELETVQVSASPEIPFAVRVKRIKAREKKLKKTRSNWVPGSSVAHRLKQVEKLLGLRPLDE